MRELGLPRDALLNVIVRGDQAMPPRGSTRIEAGDRLHVLVRREVALEFRDLLERWRDGPDRAACAPRPPCCAARSSIFSDAPVGPRRRRPRDARDRSTASTSSSICARAATQPGALVALADGRYAITGPASRSAPPRQLQDSRGAGCGRRPDDAEQAWWQEVIGAVARVDSPASNT